MDEKDFALAELKRQYDELQLSVINRLAAASKQIADLNARVQDLMKLTQPMDEEAPSA